MNTQPLTPEEKKQRAQERQVRNNTERQTGDRRRNVFNGTEGKLSIDGDKLDKNYHYRIFNDTPGRVQQAIAAGYEFVKPEEIGGIKENVVSRNTDLGDKVRYLVNPSAAENEQYGYLMKIKLEWFEEDQESLQSKNDRIDEAIRSGKNTKDGSSAEGFYTPRSGVKYDHSDKF